MAVLPGEDSVGPLDDSLPRRIGVGAWNPRVVSEDTSAAGRGIDQFGTDLGNIGGQLQEQQNQLASSQAHGATAAAFTGILSKLPTITDPAQLSDVAQNVSDTVNTQAASIPNPRVRELYLANQQQPAAEMASHILARGRELINQNGVAGLEQAANTTISTAAALPDENSSRHATDNLNIALQDAVSKGIINPQQKQEMGQRWVEQYVQARHDYIYTGGLQAFQSGQDMTPWIRRLQDFQRANPLDGTPSGSGIANTNLPPEAQALLKTIYGPESGGAYNRRYTPGGGADFTGFADHPRIAEKIAAGPDAGSTSDAAGAPQFLSSTWDAEKSKLGLKDFSPPNQDSAAWDLAQTTYKQNTGGDLLTALRSHDPATLTGVADALKGQWSSLPGGHQPGTTADKFVSAFSSNLQGASQTIPGLPNASPSPAALPNASNSYFIGDSVADGLRRAAGAPGDTVAGRNPDHVQDAIDDADPSALKGKTIYLSSGASNSPGAAAALEGQLESLKAKGVDMRNVLVIGVGDRADFTENGVNKTLSDVAGAAGATFTGPLDPTNLRRNANDNSDNGVHLADWQKGLMQVAGSNAMSAPGTAPTSPLVPPKSQWPAGTDRVTPNADGTLSYVSADGTKTPVPGMTPTGMPGAPLPNRPTGSLMDMLPAQAHAQMNLRTQMEIDQLTRMAASGDTQRTNQVLGMIAGAKTNVIQGEPMPQQAWDVLKQAALTTGNQQVYDALASADAVRTTLQSMQGQSPQMVQSRIDNIQTEYDNAMKLDPRDPNGPFSAYTDMKKDVLDAARSYQKTFVSDVHDQPLLRAAKDNVIPRGSVKPLDASSPTFAQDILNRGAIVDTASKQYGVPVPLFLPGEGQTFAESLTKVPGGIASVAAPPLINQMADDESFRKTLTGMARSADPGKMRAGFGALQAISTVDPMKFDGRFGKEDSTNLSLWNRLLQQMPPEDASKRMMALNDPNFASSKKYRDEAANQSLKNVTDSDVVKMFSQRSVLNPMTWANGAVHAPVDALDTPDSSSAALRYDYVSAFKDYYALDGDASQASAHALDSISRKWGASPVNNNRIMPYPPESRYPAINGKFDYVGKQLDADVKAKVGDMGTIEIGEGGEEISGRTPAQESSLAKYNAPRALVADSQTKADIDGGKLPSYRVVIQDPKGQFHVLEDSPGKAFRFYADPTGPQAEADQAFSARRAATTADMAARHAVETGPSSNLGSQIRQYQQSQGEGPRVP